jgi:hypothetical protein
MLGKKGGFVTKLQDKLNALTPNCKFIHVHSVIHQEVLCSKLVNMEHVLSLVKKSVNFIHACGLNQCQFAFFFFIK